MYSFLYFSQTPTADEENVKSKDAVYNAGLYDEHCIGVYKIHINRLVQANVKNIAARDINDVEGLIHQNAIAQELKSSYMVFQSPLQALVNPVVNIPGTFTKAQFTQLTFEDKCVTFTVFGHQHFLEAIKIARQWAKDNNDEKLYKRLTYLQVNLWVGLRRDDAKLLANIHNDTGHKVRNKEIWQTIMSLRLNYKSKGFGYKTVKMDDKEVKVKLDDTEVRELKKECFALENMKTMKQVNSNFVLWKIACFPKEMFAKLLLANTMCQERILKGSTPKTKSQLADQGSSSQGKKRKIGGAPEKPPPTISRNYLGYLTFATSPEDFEKLEYLFCNLNLTSVNMFIPE